ncbi:CBS domain-containing protein [Methylobacterium nigriterrae]|uniref:CBS domain-containing protein n=1 Tax=Methylobacterium nigriterrae TaxID=3127512 RepID=UPI003013D3FB
MREHHVGALAVTEGGGLIGIISERDVIARVIAVELDPQLTPVRAVMTSDPQTIDVEECLADALQKMLDGHFRHLPVMQEAQVMGMISMRDIPTEYRLMRQRYEQMRAQDEVAG